MQQTSSLPASGTECRRLRAKPNSTNRAFSLIELLVTLAIMAIVCAIIMNAYSGIQNSALAVAQQKDQAELNQVLAELRISGGNLLATVPATPGLVANATQAGELTNIFQQAISGQLKTVKGTLGGAALPSTDYIIPYPYYDQYNNQIGANDISTSRIVINPATGTPGIQTSGQGFIVVNTTTSTHWTAFTLNKYERSAFNSALGGDTNTRAVSNATPTNTAGTKYASQQAYLWDDDPVAQSGPRSGGGGNGGPLYSVAYAYAFSPSGTYSTNGGVTKTPTGLPAGSYNFADYTGQTITSTQATGTTIYYPGGTGATAYIYAYLTDGSGNTVTGAAASAATSMVLSNFKANGDSADSLPATTSLACPGGYAATPGIPAGIAGDSFTTDVSNIPGVLYTVPVCQYSGGSDYGILPQNWESGASSLAITAKASCGDANVDTTTPAIAMISASPMIHLDAPGFTITNTATGATISDGNLIEVNNATITITDINGANPPAGAASDNTYGNYTATGLDSGDGFTDGSSNNINYTNPDPSDGG